MRENRIVKSGQVVNYENKQYIIENNLDLIKKNAELRHYRNGDLRMFLLNGEELKYREQEKWSQAA